MKTILFISKLSYPKQQNGVQRWWKTYKSAIAEVSTAFKNLYRYSSGNNGIRYTLHEGFRKGNSSINFFFKNNS